MVAKARTPQAAGGVGPSPRRSRPSPSPCDGFRRRLPKLVTPRFPSLSWGGAHPGNAPRFAERSWGCRTSRPGAARAPARGVTGWEVTAEGRRQATRSRQPSLLGEARAAQSRDVVDLNHFNPELSRTDPVRSGIGQIEKGEALWEPDTNGGSPAKIQYGPFVANCVYWTRH